MLSGGYYKSAIHRVVQPPQDQRRHRRLGVLFATLTVLTVRLLGGKGI